jgi:hypothetical protein
MTANLVKLSTLASRINKEHALAEQHAKTALEHVRNAGTLLLEAKGLCKHGEWLTWLEANFDSTRQTAANYMRLAERWEELNVKRVLHLPLRAALAELAGPKAEPEASLPGYLTQPPERLNWYCKNWLDDQLFLTLLLDTAGETPEAISQRLGVDLEETLAILDPIPPLREERQLARLLLPDGPSTFLRAHQAMVWHFLETFKQRGYERAAWSCGWEGYQELAPALTALARQHERRAKNLHRQYCELAERLTHELEMACVFTALDDARHAMRIQRLSGRKEQNLSIAFDQSLAVIQAGAS